MGKSLGQGDELEDVAWRFTRSSGLEPASAISSSTVLSAQLADKLRCHDGAARRSGMPWWIHCQTWRG